MELHETKNNLVFRLQQYEAILAKKEAVIASMANIKQQHEKPRLF